MTVKKISLYIANDAAVRVQIPATDPATGITGRRTFDKSLQAHALVAGNQTIAAAVCRMIQLGGSTAGATIIGMTQNYGEGQEVVIYNNGTVNATLINNSGAAGAGTKFNLPMGDFLLKPGDSVELRYNGTSTMWDVIGAVGNYDRVGSVTTGIAVAGSGTLATALTQMFNVLYVTGTSPITVNLAAGIYDGQVCWIEWCAAVASVTWGANMAAVAGAIALPASVAGATSNRFIWSKTAAKWYHF